MVFIKLTQPESNEPIWINTTNIQAVLREYGNLTKIIMNSQGGRFSYVVKESPEEVMELIRKIPMTFTINHHTT